MEVFWLRRKDLNQMRYKRERCSLLSFLYGNLYNALCNIRKFVADLRCSIFSVLRQPLTASLHPPPAALAVATPNTLRVS